MSKHLPLVPPPRVSDLSDPKRRLLALMQWMNYGRICGITICGGEPDLNSEFDLTLSVKVNSNPPPVDVSGDFQLQQKMVELFEKFAEMGNGVIETLEVQAGLPFRFEIRHRLNLAADWNFGDFATPDKNF